MSAIVHFPTACYRKRQYVNEREAWSVIFKMRARHQDTERLRPYRCDHCLHWHLGRSPPSLKLEMPPVRMPYVEKDL